MSRPARFSPPVPLRPRTGQADGWQHYRVTSAAIVGTHDRGRRTARRPAGAQRPPRLGSADFRKLYLAEPLARAALVKEGAPASLLPAPAAARAVPKERLYETIGGARATADRKLRADARLDPDATERALGLARLLGQVEQMLAESGDPEQAADFDAAAWVADFLGRPHPALGGRRPGDLMDTADGRGVVSALVAQMQSGAYA